MKIAITPGEPAGIGPDLAVQLPQNRWPVELVLIADPELLQERAARLGRAAPVLAAHDPARPARPGTLSLLPVPRHAPTRCGHADPANAPYVLATLRHAVEGCQTGAFAALVTGPAHKGVINEAGIPFTGHTEFIAEITGGTPLMMLAAPGRKALDGTPRPLRVALATTHLPLREVADAIQPERLARLLRLLHSALRERLGLPHPRILVAGLNPHAGEGGHLGREEIEIIGPVLERLRGEGLSLYGPLPADTLFTPRHLDVADAVLAMYHDQGLPVLKHVGFGNAVNITLGLPILRTSVDHGTALDIAGSGRADPGSLETAIDTAIEFCQAQRP